MGVVSITVPSIGFPPAAGASKLIDLTDVDAGAAGSKIGQFLTELAPVSGARRFGFMAAAGGLKVADWDASGAALPLDPAAIGGTLATIDGIATVAPFNPVPVVAGVASFYGLTMPIGLPAVSAALDLNWPLLPSDAPSFILTLLHDQSADLSGLVEAVLTNSAAGVSGLIAGAESGNGFGLTFPNKDEFPLTLPELGSSILLTINNDGSLVFGGFGDNILTDSAAANGYAISYLMVVMGVSESLPPLSFDIGASSLGGGYGAAELPDNVSDLDTIYRVTNGGIYAGQTLNQNDHVIFYNDQADFLIIRLPADFDPDDFADLIDNAIAASVEAGGVVDNAIDTKLNQSVEAGGVVDNAIDTKLNQSVEADGVVDTAIDTKLQASVEADGVVDNAIDTKLNQSVEAGGVVDNAINEKSIIKDQRDAILFGLPSGFEDSGTPLVLSLINGILYLRGVLRRSASASAATGAEIDLFSVPFSGGSERFRMFTPAFNSKVVSYFIDDPASIQFSAGSNIKLKVFKNSGASFFFISLVGDLAAGSADIQIAAKLGFGFAT